jgi:hypothetical protein
MVQIQKHNNSTRSSAPFIIPLNPPGGAEVAWAPGNTSYTQLTFNVIWHQVAKWFAIPRVNLLSNTEPSAAPRLKGQRSRFSCICVLSVHFLIRCAKRLGKTGAVSRLRAREVAIKLRTDIGVTAVLVYCRAARANYCCCY